MSKDPRAVSADKSAMWLQKGMATIVRMGRIANRSSAHEAANPLGEIFSDLIAYMIFFEASCAQEPMALSNLREKLIALVNVQEERSINLGVAIETFREARFAVLSWVDETILNSNWPHRGHWQHLMLAYYGTLNAGEEFFRRLDKLTPQANDVREIYYLCLCLGFEGEYAFGDSRRDLKDLKQRLYKQLCNPGGDIRQNYTRLFPEAYQRAAAAAPVKEPHRLLWYISAASVPIILFGCFWFLLWQKSSQLMIAPPAPVPPSTPAWNTCIIETLKGRQIPAEETTRGVVITLASVLRFAVNSPELSPEAQTLINDIAEIIKQCKTEERSVVVEGHASKEGNPVLNRELSEKRARNVAEAFVRAGFRREKISSWGYGSDLLKPGATDAENRRVEITIVK
jgi:type VI secretion system protein ImpK